jgi:hypothetical protein
MHLSYLEREEKYKDELAKDAAAQREMHAKTRGSMIMKMFSERISPGIHDAAAKKEGFGVWKEAHATEVNVRKETELRDEIVIQKSK